MGYVEQTLGTRERMIARGKWPMIFWLRAWAALIFLGIIGVGIFLFVRDTIVMLTTEFAVTDARVVMKQGWLERAPRRSAFVSIRGLVRLVPDQSGEVVRLQPVQQCWNAVNAWCFPPMADPLPSGAPMRLRRRLCWAAWRVTESASGVFALGAERHRRTKAQTCRRAAHWRCGPLGLVT
ncbi:MAG: hypothetical protein R3C30_09125 [Hyphomonadaceae bacterium]